MFDKLEPKKEVEKNEKSNNFSLPGLNDYQINKISGKEMKRLAPPPPALTDFDKRISDLERRGKKRGRRNMFIGTIGAAIIALIVMFFVYYISQDVSNISDEMDKEINEIPDLSNRKNTPKIPLADPGSGIPGNSEEKYKTDPSAVDMRGENVSE